MTSNTFTASGTPLVIATSAMTQSNLRALLRLALTSSSNWPDATLNQWLREAIRAYSAEFPRRLRYTLTLATGTQTYDLPADILGVTGVEYPAGENPPELVTQVEEHSLRFQSGGPFYALLGAADTGALSVQPVLLRIRFSQDVATGETAVISYAGLHLVPAQDGDYTSVPREHWEALFAFCEFRAQAELEHDASWKECITNDKLAQLAVPTQAAWRRYREVMDGLRDPAPAAPGWVSWGNIGL
jgi:hypothetical protein